MKVQETPLPGVLVIEPPRFGDERGYFSESWSRAKFASIGVDCDFVQDNHSLSRHAGTVRGLHYQGPPHAQAKLVRCGRGRLFDVAVDFRVGSPTFGQWFGTELSFENGRQLFIPAGYLHGFSTLEDDTEVLYKCSDIYAPQTEGSVRFDDPDLAIDWRLDGRQAILSQKDEAAPWFAEAQSPFSATE